MVGTGKKRMTRLFSMHLILFWLECRQGVGWNHSRSEIYYLFRFILTLHQNHTNQRVAGLARMLKKLQDHIGLPTTTLAVDLLVKAPGLDHLFSFTP
jgi:hypothetical protein